MSCTAQLNARAMLLHNDNDMQPSSQENKGLGSDSRALRRQAGHDAARDEVSGLSHGRAEVAEADQQHGQDLHSTAAVRIGSQVKNGLY